MTLLSAVSLPSPTHQHNIFRDPRVYMTFHQLVTMAEIPPSIQQFPHQEEYGGFRFWTSYLNHVMLHLNVLIPLVVVHFFCLFEQIFCAVFLWMLCSVFHTHMALSQPWGISSSWLMWILVWVKCSTHLCINAYCIINVFCEVSVTEQQWRKKKNISVSKLKTSELSPETRRCPTGTADRIFMPELFWCPLIIPILD